MTILELNYWLAPGGAERFIVDLSNQLALDSSNNVIVCTLIKEDIRNGAFYKKQLYPKVRYINLGGNNNYKGKIKLIFQVLNLIRTINPDVVHCHLSAFFYCVIPSIFFRKIKFVNTLHNIASKNIKHGLDKKIKTYIYKSHIIPVTISKICYDSFTDFMGFNTSILIDNGCRDVTITNKIDEVKKEIDSYKITPETRVFINIARIQPQKNHILLVESFNKLFVDEYNAVLIVIGAYDINSEIWKQIESINKTGRIHFLGTRNNVFDYLVCCDAFCLSSKWEGASIALLEAAFSGCYPICTPVGGCIDSIPNADYGILSKDLTVDSYTESLKRYFHMPIHDRQKISKLYHNKFSMKVCADKYMKLFKE